jgi:serine/threonine-protein kinase RsbT
MRKVEIRSNEDVDEARIASREMARALEFSLIDTTRIAAAVSELARNTVIHGGGGVLEIDKVTTNGSKGLRCVFFDNGPGILDTDQALLDGYSTCCGAGMGLSGAKRLMDEFRIDSAPGRGTRVAITKWS